ncbi:AAA domain-containing protein [Aquimarina algicola]|uniref:AAA family ATPase n=1 Tax=Aquimarina algicola TaxID=2589995 RepID=A0A504IVS0_9FLAO|nr:AAA domain-containing protein [Aquimarina algicola]TPN82104.1 hypothetical protein FHK87_22005 [Aquimarina algicola]
MDILSLIKYFTDCYKADNREFGIENFFSTKFENQYLQKNEELINGDYPKQFLPDKVGISISKNLQLYSRDKQLFYCSIFLIGKRKIFNKKNINICAPLFFYPAEIIKTEEGYFIKLEQSERKINNAFLKTLDFKESYDTFLKELQTVLKQEIIDYPLLAKVQRTFEKHVVNVQFAEDMVMFPKLIGAASVKKRIANKDNSFDNFEVIPSSGLMVSSKASNINSIVNELEVLQNTSDYSSALISYLQDHSFQITEKYDSSIKPFILNEAQENSVKAANTVNKSVVVGPPGTGKSYTVSAIAIDYLSQGKSVLIATQTDEALQVLSDKLQSFSVGRYRVKAGGSRYKRSLISSLEKFLYKFDQLPYRSQMNRDWSHLSKLIKRLKEIEVEFSNIEEKSIDLTQKVINASGIAGYIRVKWLKLFRLWQKQEWRLIDEYILSLKNSIKEGNNKLMGQLLNEVEYKINFHRKELQALVNSLKNDDLALQSDRLNAINFNVILKALPVWLVKIDNAAEVLPMHKEMFDLLIIDEATQCDMASVLPLMQRAKHLVVTGDPKQLRHISFLSKQQMFDISKKHNLKWDEKFNYRKKSLLDFTLENIESSNQLNFLNEHYRSLPDIIAFSNQKFYDDSLLVINDLPKYRDQQSVFIHEIEGKRNTKGANEKEAKEIIKYVKKLIRNEDSVNRKQATTLGIISPFRDQVSYLGRLIRKEITLSQLQKHNIRIGTPFSFQGDERDIMLISLAIDDDSHHSAMNYLNREDVFNVMITRARNVQEIFLSASIEKLKFDSLLREYLEGISHKENTNIQEENHLDAFINQMKDFLEDLPDINYYLGYQLSGFVIDVLVEKNGNYLGIDLIGFPGDFQRSFSIERYKVLYRIGIQVIPLSYMTWHFDETLKEKLRKKINNL